VLRSVVRERMALFVMDVIGTLLNQPAADKHTCIDAEVTTIYTY
jgi:hypothetical protein